jgi:hypothetical protein
MWDPLMLNYTHEREPRPRQPRDVCVICGGRHATEDCPNFCGATEVAGDGNAPRLSSDEPRQSRTLRNDVS